MAALREAGTKTAGEQRVRGNKCRRNGKMHLKKKKDCGAGGKGEDAAFTES